MNWAQQAQAILAKGEGYQKGNQWEGMLRRSLQRTNPQLVKELGNDLDNYLIVRTWGAMDLANRLEDQGTPPETARSLAINELLGSE